MTEKRLTVYELHEQLTQMIKQDMGNNTVELSVNYDHCDHIQKLGKIYWNDGFNWITLKGAKND